jgi:glycosyltransferase involved in cell wall biosynthesis
MFSGPAEQEVPDHLSDPQKTKALLEKSVGVSALIDELLEFKPTEIPGVVFWPGYDEHLPWGMSCDKGLREKLGIDADEYVVTYTGNLHAGNAAEIRSLYLAVALVNRRGLKLRLVRTGQDFAPLADMGEDILRENSIELGFRPREELPRLLSIADVLVQPGKVDSFNLYRFPSKLPEFLKSRRPVVLPDCNVGSYLENNHNAIVLREGGALEIAEILEELLLNPVKREFLGNNGAEYSKKHLRWGLAAQKMVNFYGELLMNNLGAS